MDALSTDAHTSIKPKPPVMNERLLYQTCITCWRIVPLQPPYSSCSCTDWFTVDVIQSAIMTQWLINLKVAPQREGAGGGDRKTGLLSTHVHAPRAHTHTEPCQLSAATLSPTMRDHGKVFTHCNGLTLGSIGQYWSTNQISDGFIHYRPGLERITARAARLFLQRQFKSNRVQKKNKNKNKVLFLLLLPALTPPLLAPPPTR